jgi:3-hydroxy-5-methyl-1-naphthoate 3-O-methyltransferase
VGHRSCDYAEPRTGHDRAEPTAARIGPRPVELLVTACASIGLLEREDGRYVNSALADEFLVPGKAYHFGGWVHMLDRRLYPAWGRLTEAVRTNRPTSWNPDEHAHLFDSEDPKLLAVFWEAMHSLSTFTARELGAHVDLSASTALLDVGGGSGAYDIELCRRYPNLRATVFDLPPVCEIASKSSSQQATRTASRLPRATSSPITNSQQAMTSCCCP